MGGGRAVFSSYGPDSFSLPKGVKPTAQENCSSPKGMADSCTYPGKDNSEYFKGKNLGPELSEIQHSPLAQSFSKHRQERGRGGEGIFRTQFCFEQRKRNKMLD